MFIKKENIIYKTAWLCSVKMNFEKEYNTSLIFSEKLKQKIWHSWEHSPDYLEYTIEEIQIPYYTSPDYTPF